MIDVKLIGEIIPEDIIRAAGLEENGPVQTAFDNAVVEYSKPYWARDTGFLMNSAVGMGTGLITYTADYASWLYYGIRMGMPINYHLDKNPMAGAYPIERMVADHLNDLIEEAQKYVGDQQH